jgi:hypothetical protein
MRKFYLTVLMAVAVIGAFAQARCGFDEINEKLMKTDPGYAATINANNEFIRNYIATHPPAQARTNSALYTIPVVVHVVHTGGAEGTIYNPTDAQIIGAINYLNSIYDGSDASLFGGVGDMQIQFALAQRDPNCNPTNGINHVDGSSIPNYTAFGVNRNNSNGATEASVKNFVRWDANNYYNIWVVNKIDGADGTSGTFIAGFAYFPGSSASLDGTMMLATQMKAGAKTLPHEIGHALNLYHTFQGSNNSTTCPVNNNCSFDGDMVCDTDPTPYYSDFLCKTSSINNCTGTWFAINTENNFMGYTNCYTLFTAGQKSRALAAMALPSRVSLANSLAATPTYSGAVQCPPKINFESTGLSVAETTVGTVDCRKYKDYNVSMTIGSNPTANATVTLQLGGTASPVTDYNITTNGNFTSPSLQLNFPAGSHSSQSFTVRVFDNAIVEGSRTLYIDFTVNDGGGNAQKGTRSTLFTMVINDNDNAAQPYATTSGTLGSNSYGAFYQPFRCNYPKSRTQAVYLASELQALGFIAGTPISSIGFNVTSKSSSAPYALNIGMKNTAASTLGSFETGTTNVYSGSYSTTVGTNTIALNTSFVWDGVSNLLVEICFDNSVSYSNNDNINGSTKSTQMCIWSREAVGVGCSLAGAQVYASIGSTLVRPDLTFSAQAGNPVEYVLNATQSEYVGPYADVYFKTGNNVIGRLKNLTAFDYGCTSFKIDRDGNATSNFWNTTPGNNVTNKSYLITPTHNSGTGQYEVTLYYTAAEKAGYEAGTGKTWTNTSMIRTPLAVNATNSSNTNPWNVKVQPVVTRNSFGSDYSVTGAFTGNFGGFTLGDPAAVLPLQWISFTGRITNDLNAELLWSTANESNTSHYDIEESANGIEFRRIGSTKAVGTGSNDYKYLHVKPAAGNHYYRIRQFDKDGRFSYSATVLLNIDSKYEIVAYPIPATDILTLKFGRGVQNPVIEILSADMKLLKREIISGLVFDNEINVADLSAGVYIARLVMDGKAQILRFVKQ